MVEFDKLNAISSITNFRFPCEVRVRATPLLPCRRHGKKRNGKDVPEDEPGTPTTEETAPPTPVATPAPPTPTAIKKESGKKSGKSQSKNQVSVRPISTGMPLCMYASREIGNFSFDFTATVKPDSSTVEVRNTKHGKYN